MIEERDQGGREGVNTLLGVVGCFAAKHGSDQAHERAVASVHSNRVLHEIELGPVLAGNTAIMRPKPIQYEATIVTLRDDVSIGWERGVARQ